MRVRIAVGLGMDAVAQIAGQMRAHENHRNIEHGHVDALSAPCPLALKQGRRQGEGASHAGRVIDCRRAEFHRMHFGRAGHCHDPRGGLDHVIVGGLPAARAMLAEGRERGVNEPGIACGERLIAEPERLEGPGAIVLDEYIRGGRELLEDFAVRLGLEVERDRALVGSLREEGRAHVAAVERLVGTGAAALVGLVGVLHLDHIGAQHGELIGGKRPC